jgi:hypothetical protein
MTRVRILLRSGPAVVNDPAWTIWEPAYRITSPTSPIVIAQSPGAIRQPADGSPAYADVPGGWAWSVTEMIGGRAGFEHIVFVPDSKTELDYSALREVEPAEAGYVSTELQRILDASMRALTAQLGATAAEARAVALAAGLRRGLPGGVAAVNAEGNVVNAAGAVLATENAIKGVIDRAIQDAIALLPQAGAPGTGGGGGTGGVTDFGAFGTAMARLRNKVTADFVWGIASDSTGDELTEGLPAGLKAFAAACIPDVAVGMPLWNKALDRYADLPVVFQDGTGKLGVPPGLGAITGGSGSTDQRKVIVFSDNFNRVATDIVDSSPQTGGKWQGQTGQYELQGVVAQNKLASTTPPLSAAQLGNPVYALMAASDRDGLDGTWSTLLRLNTATNGRLYTTRFWGPALGNGDGLYWEAEYTGVAATANAPAAGEATIKLVSKVGSTIRTVLTMPSTILEVGKIDQFRAIAITIEGADVIVSIDAFTPVTGKLLGSELTAWAGHDRVQFASNDDRFRADYVQAHVMLTTTIGGDTGADVMGGTPVQPGTGRQLYIYNGAIAGSIADDQVKRFARMFPLPLDVLFVNHGLNYTTVTGPAFLVAIEALLVAHRTVHPGSPDPAIVPLTQNPRFQVAGVPADRVPAHKVRQDALRAGAPSRGWFLIDTWQSFVARSDSGLAAIDSDGVHPNAIGRALQRDDVNERLTLVYNTGTGSGGSTGGGTGGSTPTTAGQLEAVPNFPLRLRLKR